MICTAKGWNRVNVLDVWLLFSEEVGELASAIRNKQGLYSKRSASSVEDEMGDVFSYLFQLATMLDVDLDQMWNKQKFKMIGKIYNTNGRRVCGTPAIRSHV